MKTESFLRSMAVAIALGAGSTVAHAIAITDVQFRIPPEDFRHADAAELLGGNDNTTGVNALGGAFSGDPWILLDKTDDSSNPFNDVTFVLTGDVNAQSGEWGLSWSGSGLPLTLDFVFVTKAANNWGAYLFEAVDFSVSPNLGEGAFEITWNNRGGNIPGLSHASLYGRLSEGGDLPPEPPGEVPVPGTVYLLGLAGAILLARRRRQV